MRWKNYVPLRNCWSLRINCICWRQHPIVKLLFSEQRDFTMFTSIWHILWFFESRISGQRDHHSIRIGFLQLHPNEMKVRAAFNPSLIYTSVRVDAAMAVFNAIPEVTTRTLPKNCHQFRISGFQGEIKGIPKEYHGLLITDHCQIVKV